ncbi:hypothetical protein PVAP13_1NG111388 [Panicum virgatum]|uniref:Serine aminopeptidase S33 domain-containing protein n=1 Tax=Panicum virgatum TaxID=38727 RepID=A0A8T0X1J3_PANVG|nr:hypothetical protein PVAP13_1NG111388 [Panicum virgatum]
MAPSGELPPATKYFWGDTPEPDDPRTTAITHAFHPLSGDVKGAVFMTHSYSSDSSWLFQSIAISYARWGYAVFCADLLGQSRSDSLRGYLGDMEAAAAASLAFFLSVRTSGAYAALPAFLFGESMGGAATLLMYLRSPPATRWTGLTPPPLLIIPDGMYPSRLRLFLYGLLFGLADTWAVLPDKRMVVGKGKEIKDPEKLRVIASNPRAYRGAPRVGTMWELVRVTELLQDSLGEVTVPFLAVHGTDDGDKELILYEGMHHSLIQGEPDENSDRVLADMRRWIDERVRRYGPAGKEAPAP